MRRAGGLALAALLSVAGVAVSVACQRTATSRLDLGVVGLGELAYLAVGVLILVQHPRHPVGRLLVAGPTVATTGTALLELAVTPLRERPGDALAGVAATMGSAGRGLGWMLTVLFLPLVFPDGTRIGAPRLRRWGWGACATAALGFTAVAVLSPTQTDLRLAHVDNPVGLPHSWAGAVGALMGLLLPVAALAIGLGVSTVASRFRHGSALRRQQVLWFALSFAPPITLFALSAGDSAQPWMFGAATLPVPVAVLVAIRQRRLYDVQLAVNRSLTYGTLWAAIAALYAVVVGGVGVTVRQPGAGWLPWLAAGVVAVSFAPMREALQRGANRLTYGQWSQPAEVLAATARRLDAATDLPGLLRELVADVGQSLGLAYVEIVDPSGRSLAVHGTAPPRAEDADELPMTSYAVLVGHLRWTRRRLRESDRQLLVDLARQLGAVTHAAGLLEAVRASQERLVLAREEERRRLRRDLHDGLGPALAGLTLEVDALRNRLDGQAPPEADAGLLALRSGIRATVVDVRRIVEGLRPPALDDLGLVDALGQLASRLAGDLDVTVEGEDVPGLSAATEVAAYRIVQEALTNVVRHADATRAVVRLCPQPGGLVVEVCDDGTGRVEPRPDGVGLVSMRERAEEIGGSFAIEELEGSGTTVRAVLPHGQEAV